jgi:CubicO group peptidase (beta-lactamase class C family)
MYDRGRGAAPSVLVVALAATACLALTPSVSAQWVVLSDRNGLFARNIPDEAYQKLVEFAKRDSALKSIAFAPNGGWVILLDKNGLFARNVPDEAYQVLRSLATRGAELKSIAFTPAGGWVILSDRSGYFARNIPDEAFQKLGEFARQGAELRSIAFAPDGGWVILAGRNGLFARNIPDEAYQKLVELAKQGAELKSVTFAADGGWVIVADRNSYFARGIPHEAFQKLGELAKQGAELKSISLLAGASIRLSSDDPATRAQVLRRMAAHKVPGLSIAVIKDGRLEWAHGYGVLRAGVDAPVTVRTRFQAASVSKPVTALAALRLVQNGTLVLDQELNKKLVSWKVPENPFTRRAKPTLRQLLSHSAGFSVHGFAGYPVGAAVPRLQKVLDGKPPANSSPIRVELLPGSKMQYSGGGYTVLQRLIMDVTGKPFPQAMRSLVLDPLGMKDSTFEQPLPKGLADVAASAHVGGTPLTGEWHVYPEMAAAGLWTTPADLARFVMALQRAKQGGREPILRASLAGEMLRRQKEDAGLGVFLSGKGRSEWFSHNGSNAGFECSFTGSVDGGQGAVLMTNAAGGSALVEELLQCLRAEYNWPGL